MGRLTDDLMAMFGLKPSDRVSLPAGESKAPSATANIRTSQESGFIPASDKTELGGDNGNKKSTEDCLSCKVIGVGTLVTAAGFVCYYTFKNAKHYTGLKRVAAYGQGISLATLLSVAAGCRAFNWGPFDALNRDKPTSEQLKEDFKTVRTLGEKWDQWRTSR